MRVIQQIERPLGPVGGHFAGFLQPFNLCYVPIHALVGMVVVYAATQSLASVSLYVVLDAIIHGIFVHELAHRAGNRVNRNSDVIGSAFFFFFHVFAAFALASLVTLGDFKAALAIGIAEPLAQGGVQYLYRMVWRKLH